MSDKALDQLEDEIANQLISAGSMLCRDHIDGPAMGAACAPPRNSKLQWAIEAIRYCDDIMVTMIEGVDGETWDARWLPVWGVTAGAGDDEMLPVAMVLNRWPSTDGDTADIDYAYIIDLPWSAVRDDISTLDEMAMDWAYELADAPLAVVVRTPEAVH